MLQLAAEKLCTIGLYTNSEYTVLYITKLTKARITTGKGCRSLQQLKVSHKNVLTFVISVYLEFFPQ